MAGSSLREDSPRGRASAGTSGAVTGIPAIVVLLATGLILRLIIAYVLLPGSGFPNDLGAFQYWGNDIAQHGPIGFYARTGFIDYPPVYLLMLGAVSFVVGGNLGEAVKVLPMLADLGLAAQGLGSLRLDRLLSGGGSPAVDGAPRLLPMVRLGLNLAF